MPSLIEGNDRQTVKRMVSKTSNKIHAVAIVRLYVAYPDKNRWLYTGLQGAVVLADDLVGHTYWMKLVDISPANRGVIWDQEIYDSFSYNQDRIFFHTFELEQCVAGLSFADDKEAKKFKQKIDEREKIAHKNTKANHFGKSSSQADGYLTNGKVHGRFGGIGDILHMHKPSTALQQPLTQRSLPLSDGAIAPQSSKIRSKDVLLNNIDSALLSELLAMGLTEDQLAEHADFIRIYVEQKKSNKRKSSPSPSRLGASQRADILAGSKRGPAPIAPPPRRRGTDTPHSASAMGKDSSPPLGSPRTKFRAPPPIADAGKFAHDLHSPTLPSRGRTPSNAAGLVPPPPPRPLKVPLGDVDVITPKSNIALLSLTGHSATSAPPPSSVSPNTVPPPPPPSRNSAPTLLPTRERHPSHIFGAAAVNPPPLPPKTLNGPPLLAPSLANVPSSKPPLPPMTAHVGLTGLHTPPQSNNVPVAPLPPPLPIQSGITSSSIPPPLSEGLTKIADNELPSSRVLEVRGGLLADIQKGARLKKVSEQEKRDRSSALVTPSSVDGVSSILPSGPTTATDHSGLAGALASALAARKSKVSASDDEDDKDDW